MLSNIKSGDRVLLLYGYRHFIGGFDVRPEIQLLAIKKRVMLKNPYTKKSEYRLFLQADNNIFAEDYDIILPENNKNKAIENLNKAFTDRVAHMQKKHDILKQDIIDFYDGKWDGYRRDFLTKLDSE